MYTLSKVYIKRKILFYKINLITTNTKYKLSIFNK